MNKHTSVLFVSPVSTDSPHSISLYTKHITHYAKKKLNNKAFLHVIIPIFPISILTKLLEAFVKYIYYPLKIVTSTQQCVHILDHSYGFLIPFSKIRKKHTIITLHNSPKDILQKKFLVGQKQYMTMPMLNTYLFRYSIQQLRKAHCIICVSRYVQLEAHDYGIDSSHTTIIPMPISDQFFQKPTNIAIKQVKNYYKKSTYSILSIGNNHEQHKNISHIIKTLALLLKEKHSVSLIRIGDPLTRTQSGLAKNLLINSHIYQLGNIHNQSVLQAAYRLSTVLLFPSWIEGCPAPPLEALACKLPVVVSDIQPHKEILKDRVYYTKPNNPKKSANIIKSIFAKDPTQHSPSSQFFRKYRWKYTIQMTFQLYEKP